MRFDHINLPVRLREERERVKLSTSALAEKMGIARPTQTAYETGNVCPAFDYLVRLEAVGIDTSYVLTGERSSEYYVVRKKDQELFWEALENIFRMTGFSGNLRFSKRMLIDSLFYIFKNMVDDREGTNEVGKGTPLEAADQPLR